MRIITDGEYFAVAKGRWIFTRILSQSGCWWPIRSELGSDFRCWTSLEEAKERLRVKSKKWWDYKDEIKEPKDD